MNVDRHERGGSGNFIGTRNHCFRRCTDLTGAKGRALRVLTLGDFMPPGATKSVEISENRYFETTVYPLYADVAFWNELADWGIGNTPDMADAMHETAVQKMTAFIESASDQEWNEFIGRAWSEEDEEE